VTRPAAFPRARWVALALLVVYIVTYTRVYGAANFLFLCNLSVVLVVAGLWAGSALLLSSQAVGILLVGTAWGLDVASWFLFRVHVIAGTEYMWDPRYPLFARLLSVYHVVLPIVLFWALRRLGYDRRGYGLQCLIAIAGVALGRFFPAEMNLNGAYVDPLCMRAWGGPLVQVTVVAGFLIAVVYPLSHALLARLLPPAPVVSPSPSSPAPVSL
jgi:hypothetical protein